LRLSVGLNAPEIGKYGGTAHGAVIEKEARMISVGKNAPDFQLKDQFGRTISLSVFKGKKHLMLLFYPLDFTPT